MARRWLLNVLLEYGWSYRRSYLSEISRSVRPRSPEAESVWISQIYFPISSETMNLFYSFRLGIWTAGHP